MWLATIAILFAVFADIGSGRPVAAGFNAADVLCVVSFVSLLGSVSAAGRKGRIIINRWLVLWVIICAAGLGIRLVYATFPFDAAAGLASLARVVFFAAFFVLLSSAISGNVVDGRAQQVVSFFLAVSTASVLVSFLFPGFSIFAVENRFFGSDSVQRASGLFAEPAWAALNIGLIGVARQERWGRISGPLRYLVPASLILTLSPIGFALLAIFELQRRRLKGPQKVRASVGQLRGLALVVLIGLAAFAAIAGGYRLFDDPVPGLGRALERAVSVPFDGSDSSATSRLRDSWLVPSAIVDHHPIFGAGVGNLTAASDLVEPSEPLDPQIRSGQSEGWNLLAWVLGSTGVLGLVAYLLFVVSCLGMRPFAIAGMIVLAFGSGGVLTPLVWLYLALVQPRFDNVKLHSRSGRSKLKDGRGPAQRIAAL